MYGWTGKILRIDLSRGNCSVEDLPADLARQYVGGRGLGDRILFDEVAPRTDPLSPENKLIFRYGPSHGHGRSCRRQIHRGGEISSYRSCREPLLRWVLGRQSEICRI
jgi:aldehyde:ferredoxin oxidoreductase